MNARDRSARNARFYEWVLAEGRRCECQGCSGQAELHHVNMPNLGRRGHQWDAYNVVKACARHHQHGGAGVAAHAGNEAAWAERWLPAPLWLHLFLRLARYARHLEAELDRLEKKRR